MKEMENILIVAGGTGGHLFPGISVAEALCQLSPNISPMFVITGRQMEREALESKGYGYVILLSQGIQGLNLISQIKGIVLTCFAFISSIGMLLKIKPKAVLCMGAYVSVPVAMAAKVLDIKIFVHEQNSIPGLANRFISRFANEIFLSFETSLNFFKGFSLSQKSNKFLVVGNPIRSSLRNVKVTPFESRKNCLLVLGGSQGAKAVNELVIKALSIVNNVKDFSVIHLSGSSHFNFVKEAYESIPIPSTVYEFRHDMENLYNNATLAISRAGAGSLFELCHFEIPSILIPFPYATNRHQHVNAQILAQKGASIVLDQDGLTPELLAHNIQMLLGDRQRLLSMSHAAKSLARPEAATLIAQEMISRIKRGDTP